jgi:hypothetical protein
MLGRVRSGGGIAALLIALCTAVPHPAAAFQSTDRCFMEPMLAPSTHYRISEITRMLQRLSPSTQTKACMLFARGLLQHFDGDLRRQRPQ